MVEIFEKVPSSGRCVVLRRTRACTDGVARRGSLPLCLGSRPANPCSSKRFFRRAIVGREVFNSISIWLQLFSINQNRRPENPFASQIEA